MGKIKKKTLQDEIIKNLRDMIRTGQLAEGEKINHNRLCEELGISLTPLREAIRLLSSEGIVRLVPNRGAYIYKPTIEEIREMFDVMGVLEGACIRWATEKMSPKNLVRIEKLHNDLEAEAAANRQEAYMQKNNIWHSFIQELAGNGVLNQTINGFRQRVFMYRFRSINLPGRIDDSIKEHREMLARIKKGDAERAEQLMRIHLKNQSAAVEKLYQAQTGQE